MNLQHFLLIMHLFAAAVWVGGHILLLTSFVPLALRNNDAAVILNFESRYEKLGMTSLVLLVASGIAMALNLGVYPSDWFEFELPIERVVSVKLSLLLSTVAFAISAQKIVIPRLRAGTTGLTPLIVHITMVTAIGAAMLVLGSFIRYGGL